MLPALFLSHGSPMLVLEPCPARDFLVGLGREMPRPRAILIASAHWQSPTPALGAAASPRTIHDFHGFPQALFRITYPAPGDPALAARAAELLAAAGLAARLVNDQGLDHGVWAPLILAWPEANIPVVPIALLETGGPAAHLALGRALAPLRAEDVLLVGSGSFTHDLRRLDWRGGALAPVDPVTERFGAWMESHLLGGQTEALQDYRARAPDAVAQHPTEEHLLPLFFAAGAGGPARLLHSSSTYGSLRMDAYAFS
jgi:4,5-DOPA dioxygenase extradiol